MILDNILSAGNGIIQAIARANGLRLSRKAVLRALFTELTANIDLLQLIDTTQLGTAECNAPLFQTIAAQLETGVVYSILYSPKETNRSLYQTLGTMVPLTDDEGGTPPRNKTMLGAMISLNDRISLLQKLAAFDPQFLNRKLKLQTRIENILADMKTVKMALSELDTKIRFLAR